MRAVGRGRSQALGWSYIWPFIVGSLLQAGQALSDPHTQGKLEDDSEGVNPGTALALVSAGWVPRNPGHHVGSSTSAHTPQNLFGASHWSNLPHPRRTKSQLYPNTQGSSQCPRGCSCLSWRAQLLGILEGHPGQRGHLLPQILPAHLEGSRGSYGVPRSLQRTLQW